MKMRRRRYCPPFKSLSAKQRRQYCQPLSKDEIKRMDETELARYEKECADAYERECAEEYMYSRTRLDGQYDVTSKATREDNRIVVNLDDPKLLDDIMTRPLPQKYVVRVEKDGLLTYSNSDAEFEIIEFIEYKAACR